MHRSNCPKDLADILSEHGKVKRTPAISLDAPTRVFISYRRDDTGFAAAHLRHSLGRRIGEDKIFFDQETIPAGRNFETAIDEAMRGASVCLVLIGPLWLTVKSATGQRRLSDPKDYVRREIESALRANVEVIPVLVDGAKMPKRSQLPESIKELALRNAYELPWQAGILKLGNRIDQIERQRQERESAERAERERLDLATGDLASVSDWNSQSAIASFNVVIRAMEISLARQGQKVWLSIDDLAASAKTLSGSTLEHGFLQAQIVHIIDFVGIKAKKSRQRYVARSMPVQGVDNVPHELTLGRPVLCGAMVQNSWLTGRTAKTGMIDVSPGSQFLGSVMAALVGWDPGTGNIKILMPWSTWGDHGLGVMTRAAAEASLNVSEMRSIEAVKMPRSPFPAITTARSDERTRASKR